jgi:peptidoglycan-N-acetylmuramic acid deacetylase
MGKDSGETPFCHRHPTRPARRRCYHCRKPICPACQIRTEGHIFCSEACATAHRRRRILSRLERLNRTALEGRWFRLAGLAVLLVLGALVLWISSRLDRFVEVPEPALPVFRSLREKGLDMEKLDWDAPGPVRILSPESGATVPSSRIAVEGTAPPEAMVGLYVNGRKVDVQMAPQGKWRFDGVPLPERRCVIQARYFDNRGDSSFSPAVLVELRTAPASLLPMEAAAPEVPLNGLNLSRGPTSRRQVFLTFDGGSNANATEAILETLKREEVRATLFLTGEYMRRYPELVRRMAGEGHVIGNHTFSHPHLTTLSFNGRQQTLPGVTEDFLKGQLEKANDLFRLIAGRDLSPYWRAPFGEFNGQILRWAAAAGYRHVYWTPHLDTLDWVASPEDPLYKGPREILKALRRQEGKGPEGLAGGILLMHLGSERRSADRMDTVLPELIRDLRQRGYAFGTVEDAWPPPSSGAGSGN